MNWKAARLTTAGFGGTVGVLLVWCWQPWTIIPMVCGVLWWVAYTLIKDELEE